jgi:acyl-CoA thioesterase-1
MKLSFRLLIMLFTVSIHAASANAALAAEKPAAPTILVYGDSLSAAYSMPQAQGWVSLLQQRLKAQGLPYQVINASVSGETTSGGLSRLPITLRQHQPDLVLLELGANDGLRGLPLAQMRKNLEAMIKASHEAGAEVVLLGIMIPPNYGPKYTQEFSQSFNELAKRHNLPLVKFLLEGVAGKPELTLDDGLHPSASAQPKILENVWQVLGPELSKSATSSAAR